EIPTDVLSAEITDAASPRSPYIHASMAAPDARSVERARELIAKAQRPLLIAGDGIYHNRAEGLLQEFVFRTGIPSGTLRLARGTIDETSNKTWYGPAYIPCNPVFAGALEEADLVLLLGHHWEFDLEFGESICPDTQ